MKNWFDRRIEERLQRGVECISRRGKTDCQHGWLTSHQVNWHHNRLKLTSQQVYWHYSGGKENWRRMNKVPYWVIHPCQGGLSGELKDRSMSLFLPSTDTAVKIHVIVAAIHGHQVQGKVVVRVEGVLSLILMSLLLSMLLSSGPRKSLLESGRCLLLSGSSHLPRHCPCQTLSTPLCASHRSGEWILNI